MPNNGELFLQSIDFIGREPMLKLNRRPRNQTIMGGILCIMMFCIFIPAALFFGQELVFFDLPKIIETTVPTEPNDSIRFSKDFFTFFFYLEDEQGNTISIDNYLTATVDKVTINQENHNNPPIATIEHLQMKECDSNDFLASSSLENVYKINRWKCLMKPFNNSNISIKGTKHHPHYSYISVNIEKCKETPTSSCIYDNEIIEKKLRRSKLVMKYYDTEYNQREFNNYSQSALREFTISFRKGIDKEIITSLQITNFYTDIGYMFEDFRLKSFHNVEYMQEMSFNSLTPDSFNIKCIYLLDYSKAVNYRKYYKFQNWVAELGGILKALTIIGYVINYYNDRSSYYERMINELFDVDDIIKYFQYSDLENMNTKKRKKRDSVILLNAKKEKSLFDKNFNSRSNLELQQHSPSNHPINQNYFNKNPMKKISSMMEQSALSNNIPLPPLETPPAQQVVKLKDKDGTTSDVDPHEIYIENLRKSKGIKEHFEKVKKHRFSLNMFEMAVFTFCSKKDNPKYNAMIGGRQLITERSDIIYILRKNLELDRFKNLILRDNQMLLLNSLTKFMLDPERVNLIDFQHCNYDKFIDAYNNLSAVTNMVEVKLSKWVETKFRFDHVGNNNNNNIASH